MNYPMGVKVLHALDQLIQNIPRHPLRKWLIRVLKEPIKLSIISQFHNIVTKIALPIKYNTLRRTLLLPDTVLLLAFILLEHLVDHLLF